MSLGGLAIVVDGIWGERRGKKKEGIQDALIKSMVCPKIVSAVSDWLTCPDCGKRMPRALHKQQEAIVGPGRSFCRAEKDLLKSVFVFFLFLTTTNTNYHKLIALRLSFHETLWFILKGYLCCFSYVRFNCKLNCSLPVHENFSLLL